MAGDRIDERFEPSARAMLRDAIREAGGNEVYLVGRAGEGPRIAVVEVLARGHATAAPALLGIARPGEVAIHNHPSGNLLPSDADLEVAGLLGNLGVGFMIVDNPAERVYVVVEPFRPEPKVVLRPESLLEDLGPEGALSRGFAGYEHREAQVEMAQAVARAFDRDSIAAIEAGTGTGKSFAYLFPAVRFARANREKVVVSTHTINLQTQLLEKDVPAVGRALGAEVRATVVKGRGNYICLRKLEEARNEPGLFDDPVARAELEAIVEVAKGGSGDGSRQSLGFVPDPELWERVQSETDTTLRVRCPHYDRCFFYESRRRAAASDVVIVNHHLLLSDARLKQESGFGVAALLPPYRRLVIDEAHHLEEAATEHLSEQISRFGIQRVLGRLVSARRQDRGRIPALMHRLGEGIRGTGNDPRGESARRLGDDVVPAHRRLVSELDGAFLAMEQGFGSRPGKARVGEDIEADAYWVECLRPRLEGLAKTLVEHSERILDALRPLDRLDEDAFARLAGPALDVRAGARRVEERAMAIRSFLSSEAGSCRWIELKPARKGNVFKLCSAPIEVGPALRETLLDRVSTLVLTSATLRSGSEFGYFLGRIGLADQVEDRLETLALASPFDYARQAWVGVPLDLPEPNHPKFPEVLSEALARAVEASRGRAFLLFTSYGLLNRVFDRIAARCKLLGYEPLRQGTEDRHRLLERFRAHGSSVLFATSSFWEGVDVPGDALQLVVLTRLPFSVPDEPVLVARAERIEERGGDAFRDYSVPAAVLRFRQGFGRLIRTRTDRGAVLVTDSRILSKSYGKVFLEGLPVETVHQDELDRLLERMEEFLRPDPAPPDSPVVRRGRD